MRALALLSGGLDSILAVKLILDQGIEVEAVNFTSPFCIFKKESMSEAEEVARKFKIPLRIIEGGNEYLKVIRNPRYGYGRNMNPCIDCRIFILKKAKKLSREVGASFIFTGEVLGERPMSQNKKAFDIIERETGLKNKILRPLSARLLPETEAEKKGWVKRGRLLDIRGRSRKRQIELARKFNIVGYPSPAGGCLLTDKEFARKIRDLFEHKRRVTMDDITLLKIGRHFRFGKNKIIVGRNENENKYLVKLKRRSDYYFEVPDFGSPITILQGSKTKKAIVKAASLTAHYSDATGKKILVEYGREKLNRFVTVSPLTDKEVNALRV